MSLKLFITICISITSCSYYFNYNKANEVSYEVTSTKLDIEKETWTVNSSRIKRSNDISSYFVFKENFIIGIAFDKKQFTLYKTNNKGDSWEKLSTIKDFEFINIYFTSEKEGFLILTNEDESSDSLKHIRYIWKTQDSGKNWKRVYSSNNRAFGSLNFNNTGFGVASGVKYLSNDYSDYKNSLLITNNGETWSDDLSNLGDLLEIKENKRPETINYTYFSQTGKLFCLSSQGKIYKNEDDNFWSLFSSPNYSKLKLGFNPTKFGELADGEFWLLNTSMSMEEKFGSILLIKGNDILSNFTLNNYYFSDVNFISNDEVISIGTKFSNNSISNEPDKNVILYSKNRGKEWATLYENSFNNKFDSIIKISKEKFWITANNGEIISLERK